MTKKLSLKNIKLSKYILRNLNCTESSFYYNLTKWFSKK